uniref:Uncharacterized protein n=1 Tax=Eutreptiella gymnastica TaxID=73025 RepID=A0A7S4L9Z5_9EUGL
MPQALCALRAVCRYGTVLVTVKLKGARIRTERCALLSEDAGQQCAIQKRDRPLTDVLVKEKRGANCHAASAHINSSTINPIESNPIQSSPVPSSPVQFSPYPHPV